METNTQHPTGQARGNPSGHNLESGNERGAVEDSDKEGEGNCGTRNDEDAKDPGSLIRKYLESRERRIDLPNPTAPNICDNAGVTMDELREFLRGDEYNVRVCKTYSPPPVPVEVSVPKKLKDLLPTTTPKQLHDSYRMMVCNMVLPIITTYASLCGDENHVVETFPENLDELLTSEYPAFHGGLELKRVGNKWLLKIDAEFDMEET